MCRLFTRRGDLTQPARQNLKLCPAKLRGEGVQPETAACVIS